MIKNKDALKGGGEALIMSVAWQGACDRPYLLCCAAGVSLWVAWRAAAAPGGGIKVPGIVVVHDPR